MSDYPSTTAEPFSDVETIETHDGGHEVSVGDVYLATPRYVSVRIPVRVIRCYMDPRGLPGGKFERADGHVCIPTIRVEADVPAGHEYDHLDGKRWSVENYNADYVLGFESDHYDLSEVPSPVPENADPYTYGPFDNAGRRID
jgi:hypothetical protein